jgi:hypothetical protein
MATYGTYNTPGAFKLTAYAIVILASFLILLCLVRGMYHESNPGPINKARAMERAKTRIALTEKANANLASAGWVDKIKGIVRLPIARAMQLTVEAYQHPEAGHSNLVMRAQKAAAPAPQQSFE